MMLRGRGDRTTRAAGEEERSPAPHIGGTARAAKRSLTGSRHAARRALFALLGVAATLWAGVSWWNFRTAPVRSEIDAGVQALEAGREGEAEAHLKSALRLDPGNVVAWDLLGKHYLATSRWKEGADAFRQVLRLRPDAPDAYSRLAACTLGEGDEHAALRYAEMELKKDPNDVPALMLSEMVLFYMGEQRRRTEALRRLARLQPEEVEVQMKLAERLTFDHLFDEARPLLDRITRLDPGNSQAFALRGVCALDGDGSPAGISRAQTDLDEALRLNPRNAYAHFSMGRLYRRLSRAADAVAALRRAAQLLPTKPDIFYELAAAQRQIGDARAARTTRARFARLRREEERERTLRKRCAANPDDFALQRELGLLCLNKGEYREARYYLDRARRLRPDDPEALAALRRIARETSPRGGGKQPAPLPPVAGSGG